MEEAQHYVPYLNKESKINNNYYSGDNYKIRQNDDNIVVLIKDTGEKTYVDLEKMCEGMSIVDKTKVKKILQKLPAEVLIDMSKESSFYLEDKNGENRSIYFAIFDKIRLANKFDKNIRIKNSLMHETAHALDYMGYVLNTSSVSADKNFMEIYNKELQAFVDAGNEKYEEKWSILAQQYFHTKGKSEHYVTWNESEMFAECYVLLMAGSCKSQNCILTYFPKTLEAAKQHLYYIRSQNDAKRH